MTTESSYVGRFAPSPTGPLHFGSLVAAVGSYLQARGRGGKWLLRIEDIDPPRVVAGSADNILRTLEQFGFEWDGSVEYQINSTPDHLEAIDQLKQAGALYACTCSRQEITRVAVVGTEGPVYPGTCRDGVKTARSAEALRVVTNSRPVTFTDAVYGEITQNIEADIGDFVVRRNDGLIAYQLAVVVDDAAQGITEVVRGHDLLLSTPRQIWLQHLLDLPTPEYMHLPLALDKDGKKLSKQTKADPVSAVSPVKALHTALSFLGQPPPDDLQSGSIPDLWGWAIAHWDARHIPNRDACPKRTV